MISAKYCNSPANLHIFVQITMKFAQNMHDAFDIAILDALQGDASLTNAELADRVHLSASQCSRRKAALEAAGVIKGYRAVLDAKRLGLEIEAITRVSLTAHSEVAAEEFADAVQAMPEITEAMMVTGDADYVLRIQVRSLEHLADFINKKLLAMPAVSRVRSELVMRSLKRAAGLNLESGL